MPFEPLPAFSLFSFMLQIDQRLQPSQIVQFASQTEQLSPVLKNFLLESFSGAEAPEFYHGLAAGMAAAYQLTSIENGRLYLGAALATTAKQIQDND